MQKIPTLYLRSEENPKLVTPTLNPECKWVLEDECLATEKFDGSACLIRGGVLYRRHRVKEGKAHPPGWIHWNFTQPEPTGHGWAPVTEATSDQYHVEAIAGLATGNYMGDGTYELVGPSVQQNPYRLSHHHLWRHGCHVHVDVPTDHSGLSEWFQECEPMEGVVWHHPDGRMAKIKRRDFGLLWPVR